jgi:hypothetical protein
MGNKKAKQAREDMPAMEKLQSSIDKCIAGVATNNAAREEKEATREVKFDARWAMMFEKQDVKINLLKTNVAAIKRKEDLALLTADTSLMYAEVKAWPKAQCETILAEMRPPPASSTTTPVANGELNHDAHAELNHDASGNPPDAPNGGAPIDEDEVEVEEVFHI